MSSVLWALLPEITMVITMTMCVSENPLLVGAETQRLLHHESRIRVLYSAANKPVIFTSRHVYVYQSSNKVDDYPLVFIVSVSLLRTILNAC